MPLHDPPIRPAHSKVISACVSNNKYSKVNSAPQHNLDLVILDFLPLYFILHAHQYLLLHVHSYIHTPNIQKDSPITPLFQIESLNRSLQNIFSFKKPPHIQQIKLCKYVPLIKPYPTLSNPALPSIYPPVPASLRLLARI